MTAARGLRCPLWLAALLLSGCSLLQPVQLDPAVLAALPPQHEITSTPFFPQDAYQCGPAALAMVLGFHGHHRSPQALTPWLFTPDARGSFPAEMDAVARKEGFVAYPINQLEALLQEVAANHPVLVLQNLGTDWYTQWHFAVVVGFDQAEKMLVLRSGDLERRVTPLTLFDTTWRRGERWGRVLLPPGQLPVTAKPLPYLQAVADLEQTGPLPAAARAYATAQQRWPDQPLATFGLANAQLQMQQFQAASATFATLLARYPGLAPAWNNYGYALQGAGCPAAALAAVRCARHLAPQDAGFRASETELDTHAADPAHCPVIACPLPH